MTALEASRTLAPGLEGLEEDGLLRARQGPKGVLVTSSSQSSMPSSALVVGPGGYRSEMDCLISAHLVGWRQVMAVVVVEIPTCQFIALVA
jgi:hypothetical protein